jgi:hypothetical protein
MRSDDFVHGHERIGLRRTADILALTETRVLKLTVLAEECGWSDDRCAEELTAARTAVRLPSRDTADSPPPASV